MDRKLLILGDIHGGFNGLCNKLQHINDALIIQIGDFGLGFNSIAKDLRALELVNNICRKNNIELKAFRGNHDDPVYFEKSNWIQPNIELLADYSYLEFAGKKILCVGGATSVDRIDRIEGRSWWKGEPFQLREDLIKPVDILLVHSAPSWLGPADKGGIVAFYCEKDLELWEELKAERAAIDRLFELASPKLSFSGHFHRHETNITDKCTARILDIFEFFEIRLE